MARPRGPVSNLVVFIALVTLGAGGWTSCDLFTEQECAYSPDAESRESAMALHVPGREVMYASLDEGDVALADEILRDVWTLPRFGSIPIRPLTWYEDPLNQKYWRLIFYSFRHTRHLILAYLETGNVLYLKKFEEILDSFYRKGLNSPHVSHRYTSAFLVMVLSNIYWKLAQSDALSDRVADQLEAIIHDRVHFLARPENFDAHNNQGVTEAAALWLVGVNFPQFPCAKQWERLGHQRLVQMALTFIDQDGVQKEQSPWYHFYTMNFFWEIHRWAQEHHIAISDEILRRTEKMIDFATYIVQPDGGIPLLGASQSLNVRKNFKPILNEMAAHRPHFQYIRSEGAKGIRPPSRDVLLPTAGFAILRSGFSVLPYLKKTDTIPFHRARKYGDQMHLVFDVGPYRTNHSHMNALHINLYAHGKVLLSDSGLFTLERGPKYRYYNSTRAHNTVVVDGKDQLHGSAIAGRLITGERWAYQSGWHRLYDFVEHKRGVVRLGSDAVVVIDHLNSTIGWNRHRFEQTWNFTPHANLELSGNTALVEFEDSGRLMRIQQALPVPMTVEKVKGQESPLDGWYSERYMQEHPAWTLRYAQEGSQATYVTVFSLGPLAGQDVRVKTAMNGTNMHVYLCTQREQAAISIKDMATDEEEVRVVIDDYGCW